MVYRERPYSFAEVRSMPLKSHTTVTMETKPNMDVDGDCDQNELKVAHAYVYYAQGIYVDTPAHTPMGLTCTTMAQAVGGQKWVYGHTDCPTYHALVAPAIGDAGPRKEEEERPKNACFNCDSVDHAYVICACA
ncbi:hypothetical protein SARC_12312 [Sphaeroforma arctica JP610]|uniref:Uncharacterized protein n=1 Tax=Sphaeroforma arctica JP610 TaxID=667725 RepID=A0A0L0FFC0_9EUKA|nr:hypothetical protein SARC_12312 [Sphaeroforma arctica JP610]KNC75156.1 hypothetical protein SARC_12312 [Sphaeroforma arctica JP610]|eukprot:XP_014149058.1 hypothetical protein SARC_12312 [Sphaeroforma arctica JP610]